MKIRVVILFLSLILTNNLLFAQNNPIQDSIEVFELIQSSNKARTGKINYTQAIEFAESAIHKAKEKKIPGAEFRAMISLAYAKRDKGEMKIGLEGMQQAIDFFEMNPQLKTNKGYCETYIYTHTAAADLCTYFPDYTNAKRYADKALQLSKQYGLGEAQCLITLSILFSKQKQFSEAENYAKEAYRLFLSNKAHDDLGRVSAFLARYAVETGKNEKAIEFYKQSYKHYDDAGSNYGKRIALYNMADISLKTKNYTNAEEYIGQTFAITQSTDIVSSFYINMMKANIEFEKPDYSKAEISALKAFDFAKQDGTLANLKSCYELLIKIYQKLDLPGKEITYLRLLQTAKDSLYNVNLTKQLKEMSSKYESEKKQQEIEYLNIKNRLNEENLSKEKAFSDLLKSKAENDKLRMLELQRANTMMIEENQIKSATLSQVDSARKRLEVKNRLAANKLAEEEKLINALKNEADLMSENYRQQKINSILFGSVSVLLFLLFSVMIYSYRKQKSDNIKISAQKERLQYLMNELHHRVKNNLQFMISMIRMQERSIRDSDAKEVLLDAEKRLQAVSLLHEKFYNNQKEDAIDLNDYLFDLLKMLQSQHSVKIQGLVLPSSKLMLGMERILPLGMIVNELYSNVLKHQKNDFSKIKIELGYTVHDKNIVFTFNSSGEGIQQPLDVLPGFGLKLIELFVQELKGEIQYNLKESHLFKLVFKIV